MNLTAKLGIIFATLHIRVGLSVLNVTAAARRTVFTTIYKQGTGRGK